MSKRYNTPHRTHIIKTRVTEEEHADFMERLTAYGMSVTILTIELIVVSKAPENILIEIFPMSVNVLFCSVLTLLQKCKTMDTAKKVTVITRKIQNILFSVFKMSHTFFLQSHNLSSQFHLPPQLLSFFHFRFQLGNLLFQLLPLLGLLHRLFQALAQRCIDVISGDLSDDALTIQGGQIQRQVLGPHLRNGSGEQRPDFLNIPGHHIRGFKFHFVHS